MTKAATPYWKHFLAPQYWGTWLMILQLRLLALLPFKAGLMVGSCIGRLIHLIARERRWFAEVNIRLCFPELDAQQQKARVKKIFVANGIGLVETAWAYWGDKDAIRGRTTIKGLHWLEEALQQQRGVLLLGAHFSTLDLGGLLFSFYCETLDCIYRPHNNPLMDYIIAKKRSQFCHVIERKNFRKVLRSMKSNRCVWYAPDQDFGKKNAVFVPFFGQQAATITATTKLIAMNQSPILMLSHHRNADNGGYTVTINPVENFPSGDEVKDAAIVNQAIEHEIRKAPEQYMWIHRRFKTQPDGRKKLYQREIR